MSASLKREAKGQPAPAPVAAAVAVKSEEGKKAAGVVSAAVMHTPPEEVAGFVRTLFTLLRVCDPVVIAWSEDGKAMVIRDPQRFAAEICPKFFRHRNFNSFTRLLNMYQFHKVPGNGRDKSVTFTHVHFERDREGQLWRIQRKGAVERGAHAVAHADHPAAAAATDESREEAAQRRRDASERKAKRDAEKERAKAGAAKAVFSSEAPAAASTNKRTHAAIHANNNNNNNNNNNRGVIDTARNQQQQQQQQQLLSRETAPPPPAHQEPPHDKAPAAPNVVSTWMRRVFELERDAKRLRVENDRLRVVESELELVRKQVDVQTEYICQLNDGFVATPGDAVTNMAHVLVGARPGAPSSSSKRAENDDDNDDDDDDNEGDARPTPPPALPVLDPALWHYCLLAQQQPSHPTMPMLSPFFRPVLSAAALLQQKHLETNPAAAAAAAMMMPPPQAVAPADVDGAMGTTDFDLDGFQLMDSMTSIPDMSSFCESAGQFPQLDLLTKVDGSHPPHQQHHHHHQQQQQPPHEVTHMQSMCEIMANWMCQPQPALAPHQPGAQVA